MFLIKLNIKSLTSKLILAIVNLDKSFEVEINIFDFIFKRQFIQ